MLLFRFFSVWTGHEKHIIAHLAVHLLEDFQLSSLIGPVIRVVALVPVSHHAPALESSLLTSNGPLCKLPRWMGWTQHIRAAVNLIGLMFIQLFVRLYLSVWSAGDRGRWSPTPQEPSARWAGRGSPSLGCSGPVAPSASQNGYGYLSGSGSNNIQWADWLFWQCLIATRTNLEQQLNHPAGVCSSKPIRQWSLFFIIQHNCNRNIADCVKWSPCWVHVLHEGPHWHMEAHHEDRTPSWPSSLSARSTNLQIHTPAKVDIIYIFWHDKNKVSYICSYL